MTQTKTSSSTLIDAFVCRGRDRPRHRVWLPPEIERSSAQRPSLTHVPAHQVHQMFEGGAFRLVGGDLHYDVVGQAGAGVQEVGIPYPASALRGRVRAPQANLVYIADVILDRIDVVYGTRINTPIIFIGFKCR